MAAMPLLLSKIPTDTRSNWRPEPSSKLHTTTKQACFLNCTRNWEAVRIHQTMIIPDGSQSRSRTETIRSVDKAMGEFVEVGGSLKFILIG